MAPLVPWGPFLFDDLGLTPANGVKKVDASQPYQVISQEVLPGFDADAIFVVVNQDDQSKTDQSKPPLSRWKTLRSGKG
ncbi:hypothetical protein AS030_21500 [Fictibacillus enclensis]|uniref:Fe/B12 periplasmic-binding domain-containing protein n=1 Tax=Fictibacillus enclensis TaxID=1017270 RepID=A0A0V8IUJ3_9BACL|nr:hypothetical protein AS030_21500 [Fictibacillus enclensis]